MDASIADLQLSEGVKIDVFFLHLPDRETPLEETAEAMDDAWKQGKFLRWGISNFKAEEVEKLVVLCKEKGWMAPSVYQGHYNVVTRSAEKELLPMLQKYEISFHAYGPTAGGMFGGNHKTARPQGRFDTSVRLPPSRDRCASILTTTCDRPFWANSTPVPWANQMSWRWWSVRVLRLRSRVLIPTVPR